MTEGQKRKADLQTDSKKTNRWTKERQIDKLINRPDRQTVWQNDDCTMKRKFQESALVCMAVLTHARPWPWLWFIIPFQQNNRILQTKQWWFFAPSLHGNGWLRHSFRDHNYFLTYLILYWTQYKFFNFNGTQLLSQLAFSGSRIRFIAWCYTVMHSLTLWICCYWVSFSCR